MTAFAMPESARVQARLNVRAQPNTLAARVDRLLPDTTIVVDRWVRGAEVLGNDCWYGLAGREHYVWAGGVRLLGAAGPVAAGAAPVVPAAAAAPVLRVHRRANGTILPLNESQLVRHYGDPGRTPSARTRGRIVPDAAWRNQLVSWQHPALDVAGTLTLHTRAQPYFQAVFDEILQRGLDAHILTCGGTWVPRHVDWNPARPLSSHAFGVAIDLNERWNPLGAEPALDGQTGCLRALVPVFNAHGFAWGGHFTRPDGMHFELALDGP